MNFLLSFSQNFPLGAKHNKTLHTLCQPFVVILTNLEVKCNL